MMTSLPQLIETIKQITREVDLNEFLNFSDFAYHKFCVSVVKDLIKDLSKEKLKNASLNVGKLHDEKS